MNAPFVPPVPIPPITLTTYHYAAVMHGLRSQIRLYKGAATKILWVVADRGREAVAVGEGCGATSNGTQGAGAGGVA